MCGLARILLISCVIASQRLARRGVVLTLVRTSCGLFRHLASGPRTGQFSLAVDSSPALLGTQLVDQQLSLAHVEFHLWTQAVLFLR